MANHGFTYEERIDRRGVGCSVAAYLASRYLHSPEAQWRERIASGQVLVDGKPAKADSLLRRGQHLCWARPPWEEARVPLAFATVYEDEDLLAVNKPAGLPTLPGGGFLENTLQALVRLAYPRASAVHRLGRGTSGLVLFAKTPAAGRILARAWRDRNVAKTYRALVQGTPAWRSRSIETRIGQVPHPRLGSVYAAAGNGKRSRSDAAVLERRDASTLVEVRIETGRPHQIRIHMASVGHPLVGDPLYAPGGGLLPEADALPGDGGYWLHACKLVFDHPTTGKRLEVVCPPPAILRSKAD